MADIDVAQKDAGEKTWIWATVAVLAVVGLMLWLATQEKTDMGPAVMEDETTEATAGAGTDMPAAEPTELSEIATSPEDYMATTVAVERARVAATLGPRAFWADIPGQNPFLVVVSEDAGNAEIASGERLDLEGAVAEVTPEIVDQWVESGTLNEGARDEAEFATHYLQATRVRQARG